jgi:hypothetical protein
VFTARYALSPYIKQTCFVCKGLKRPCLQLTIRLPARFRMSGAARTSCAVMVCTGLNLPFSFRIVAICVSAAVSWLLGGCVGWQSSVVNSRHL